MPDPATRAPAISLLLQHNEINFATHGDFRLIDEWLVQGCDMEKDIVPSMRDAIAKWESRGDQKIKSVSYFTPIVLAARERRLSVEAAREYQKPVPAGSNDAAKARGIAWKIRKLGRLFGPQDERWLHEYEQQHGEVKV